VGAARVKEVWVERAGGRIRKVGIREGGRKDPGVTSPPEEESCLGHDH